MNEWQLQQAKARLSELIKKAVAHGPQAITVRDEPTVVILSKKDYDKIIKPKESFLEFMKNSPLKGVNIKIERDKSLTRKDDL